MPNHTQPATSLNPPFSLGVFDSQLFVICSFPHPPLSLLVSRCERFRAIDSSLLGQQTYHTATTRFFAKPPELRFGG